MPGTNIPPSEDTVKFSDHMATVALRAAQLEWAVYDALIFLIDRDEPKVGEAILEGIQFTAAIDMLRRLFRVRLETETGQMSEDLDRQLSATLELAIKAYNTGRNRVLHGAWYEVASEKAFRGRRNQRGKGFFEDKITVQDLEQIAMALNEAQYKLWAFLHLTVIEKSDL